MTLIFSSCMNSSQNHSRHRLEKYVSLQSLNFFFFWNIVNDFYNANWSVTSLPWKSSWKCRKLPKIKTFQHRTESILSQTWQNVDSSCENSSFIQLIFILIFESFSYFGGRGLLHRCHAAVRQYCRMWKVFDLAWNHKIKKIK